MNATLSGLRRLNAVALIATPKRATVVWLAIVGILLFLVVNPLWNLIMASVTGPDGGYTTSHYIDAFSSSRSLKALGSSFLLAGAASLLCVAFAVPLAWAVSRSDIPGKGWIRLGVLGAFIMPPYLGAVGWLLLASPNAGWLNRNWTALTGAEQGIFNIYSFPGLTFVVALYTFPYLFVFTAAALDMISSELEDAANILGAGRIRTGLKITLPLAAPAIFGGFILCFLNVIALFGTPAIIGLPARITVATTRMWEFFEYPVRVESAAAYAIPMLGVVVLMFWIQKRVLGRRGYAAVTGKGGERRPIALGPWRWVAVGYAGLIALLAVILPLFMLSQAAFSKAWGRGWSWQNLTLNNFHYILFEHSATQQAMLNTFIYSGLTAVLAVAISVLIAYVVNRNLVPMGSALVFLCTAPFVIPGIVFGIGYYAAYAPPPFSMNGTATIVVLALIAQLLPIAYINSAAALRSINPELEDAVRILGGSRLLSIRKVVAPVLKRSLLGALILVFIPATRELSTVLFLVGPHNRVISMTLMDLSEEGSFETLAALGMVLFVVTMAIVALGSKLLGKDFMLRRGSN